MIAGGKRRRWHAWPVETATGLIAFLAAVAAIGGLARRYGVPAPLLLVILGIAASYLPVIGPVRITPDLILIGLLPPLLYAAAVKTSLIDFRANLRPIALFSVGLVLFNTEAIGLLVWALLPIPMAAGFALGAVVAPPDAVAATAIARRVGMPRRVVTILEGESLVNDATALVLLRTAIAALAGTVSVGGVIGRIGLSVLGGLAVGVLVAMGIGFVRKKVADLLTDITISFLTPFVSYLIAEEIGASGVLSVVVTGLLLGHKAPVMLKAQSRVLEQANWATVQYVLENSVFLLIGLQAKTIVDDLGESTIGLGQILFVALAILAAVFVLPPETPSGRCWSSSRSWSRPEPCCSRDRRCHGWSADCDSQAPIPRRTLLPKPRCFSGRPERGWLNSIGC